MKTTLDLREGLGSVADKPPAPPSGESLAGMPTPYYIPTDNAASPTYFIPAKFPPCAPKSLSQPIVTVWQFSRLPSETRELVDSPRSPRTDSHS